MNRKEGLVNFAIATVIGFGGIVTYRTVKERGPQLRKYVLQQIASLMTSADKNRDVNSESKFSYCQIKGRFRFSSSVADLIADPNTDWAETHIRPQSPLAKRDTYLTKARPADQEALPGYYLLRTEEPPIGFAKSYRMKNGVSIATIRNWLITSDHIQKT